MIEESAKRMHGVKGCHQRIDSHCRLKHPEDKVIDDHLMRIVCIPVPKEKKVDILMPLSFNSAIPPGLKILSPTRNLGFNSPPQDIVALVPIL
jgi:hypothetical protein